MSTAGSAPDRRQQRCCSPATTPRAKNCRVDDSVGEHRYRHVVRGHWRDGEWLETISQAKPFQMDLAGRRRLEAVSSVPAIGQTCRPYRRTDSSRTLRDQSKGGLRCETHAAQASRGPGVSFRAELPRVHRILLSSSTADVSTKPRPQPRRRQTDCTQRNSQRDSNRRDADDA